MAEQFKPGDLVQLKSSGPVMTIKGIYHASALAEPECLCEWFSGVDLQQASFLPTSLKSAAAPSIEVQFVATREF